MNFESAVKFILKAEGGDKITKDPRDPGGTTKYGISQRAFPKIDVENLNENDAIKLYRHEYWDKYRINDLPEKFKLLFFDCCVNQGGYFAVCTLQRILKVEEDGKIGHNTITAALNCNVNKLIEEFMLKRLKRYHANQNWNTYGIGWVSRMLSVLVYNSY